MLIYKILLPAEWDQFEATGQFDGSPFDHTSGFIHCSSRDQVGSTALRVFAGEPELVVVSLDAETFGDAVRWEPASNGEPFPHIYTPVPRSAVVAIHRVAGAAHVDAALPRD
ncbi:DUF952 domain-containing protein [Phytohabitans rumicis]|uniref:Glutathione S-transferase n=1 Tax=Phytohabitans rumicis TaxID=1076125 RepID=A0A6V8LH32_9ACTN|nr:DUF952 domain-containing protein [Phytohabitans rumicis]GFJ94171.1 hypothetical protein Prum_078130 [Phytohabitans rumicis]